MFQMALGAAGGIASALGAMKSGNAQEDVMRQLAQLRQNYYATEKRQAEGTAAKMRGLSDESAAARQAFVNDLLANMAASGEEGRAETQGAVRGSVANMLGTLPDLTPRTSFGRQIQQRHSNQPLLAMIGEEGYRQGAGAYESRQGLEAGLEESRRRQRAQDILNLANMGQAERLGEFRMGEARSQLAMQDAAKKGNTLSLIGGLLSSAGGAASAMGK